MTPLSTQQLSNLLVAHCSRVIQGMNEEQLRACAMSLLVQSFLKDGVGSIVSGTIEEGMLLQDIYEREGENESKMADFIEGTGIPREQAEEVAESIFIRSLI